MAYLAMGVVAATCIFPNPSQDPLSPEDKRRRASFVYNLFWAQIAVLGIIVLLALVFAVLLPWDKGLRDAGSKDKPPTTPSCPQDIDLTNGTQDESRATPSHSQGGGPPEDLPESPEANSPEDLPAEVDESPPNQENVEPNSKPP